MVESAKQQHVSHKSGSHRLIVWSAIGVVALLAAAAATLTAFATAGPGPINVSPTAVRPNAANDFAELFLPTPVTMPPPAEPFASLRLTDDQAGHEVTIEITDLPDLDFEPAFDLFRMKTVDDWIVTPAGRVRLVAIGVADPADVPPGDRRYAPLTYHHPADLSELSVDQLPPQQRRVETYVQSDQIEPTYRFVFEFDGFDEPDAIDYDVHDAATEVGLTSGYSYGTTVESAFVEVDMAVWHGPEVVLAMDLAHGPLIEHDIPAEPGQRWRHGPLHIEVLRRLDRWPRGGHSYGTNDKRFRGSFGYRDDVPAGQAFNGVLIGVLPQRSIGGLDLDLIDVDGNVIRDRAHIHANHVRYVGGEVDADEIAAVRARWRPHFKRFIWTIPALPTVGSTNGAVTDLAEVRLPRATFDSEWQLEDFLEDALQIEIDYSTVHSKFNAPPGYFPVAFEDVTVREILDHYLRHVTVPPDHRVILEISTMTLTTDPTWYGKLRSWLNKTLDGWF